VEGGGRLKMLLLASLQARACTIATEISVLLRTGFPQAAKSRNRTLYEQNVISFILVNDKSYEICERYHGSAPIEAMRYITSHNEYAAQLGWKTHWSRDTSRHREVCGLGGTELGSGNQEAIWMGGTAISEY
jgi:hypothetical protein